MRITSLLSKPECYMYVTGVYGCGKTYTVEKCLSSYKYLHFDLTKHNNIQSIITNKPIEYIFHKDKFVIIIDDCDMFEKEKQLTDIYDSLKVIYKKIIFICETKSCEKFTFFQHLKHIHIDKIPYYTYKTIVTNKVYRTKEYYMKEFNGDLRQLMNQSKLNLSHEKDVFSDKNTILSHVYNNKYIEIGDASYYSNIMLESYINFNDDRKMQFALRMNTSFIQYKKYNYNYYLKLYYPTFTYRNTTHDEIQNVNWLKGNLNWTRLSNIKYRKKTFQSIRRSINYIYTGFENYEKIIKIRNDILLAIKERRIKDSVSIMDYYGIPYKFINHLPKLQIGDEFHSYISRLKPFNSYINKL